MVREAGSQVNIGSEERSADHQGNICETETEGNSVTVMTSLGTHVIICFAVFKKGICLKLLSDIQYRI